MAVHDSYDLFIKDFSGKTFSEDEFINWGIKHIIFIDKEKAKEEWEEIKKNWKENKNLCIRNSGRNGQSSKYYIEFYKQFQKTIKFDVTNNEIPSKTIQSATGKIKYDKNKHSKNLDKYKESDIRRNYQVSHIWGHTHNALLFPCPWNICFVPKMFDPLTGHEAKGEIQEKFQKKFIEQAKKLYSDLIQDYNKFIDEEIIKTGKIDTYVNYLDNEYKKGKISKRSLNILKENIKNEFEIIEI